MPNAQCPMRVNRFSLYVLGFLMSAQNLCWNALPTFHPIIAFRLPKSIQYTMVQWFGLRL
jgi:hypothetical protein